MKWLNDYKEKGYFQVAHGRFTAWTRYVSIHYYMTLTYSEVKLMNCSYVKTVVKVMILFSLSLFFFGANDIKMTGKQRIVLDFEKSDSSNDWFVINDGVMGGLSSSSFQVTKTGRAVFSGIVSLQNNGGFASANMKPSQFDLKDSDGIRFRVKGDGKTYKISLKNDDRFNGFSYRFAFSTQKDKWLTLDVPFTSFIPMFMGQTTSAPPVDKSNIKTFGFLISDKQAGPFRLEIDWIGGYGKK